MVVASVQTIPTVISTGTLMHRVRFQNTHPSRSVPPTIKRFGNHVGIMTIALVAIAPTRIKLVSDVPTRGAHVRPKNPVKRKALALTMKIHTRNVPMPTGAMETNVGLTGQTKSLITTPT